MAGEERKRDFINRITTVLAYLTLVVNSSVDTFSREKERKTSLQKVIRGGGGGGIVCLRPPLLLSNTFSFVIRKDSGFLFEKFHPRKGRLYFHATPFALNEFHSANRRESLPSPPGFLLFTRFLPPSRQFP